MLTSNKAIIVICFLGTALSIVLSGLYFRFSYFEPDTVSYSFQAKLFARGKLSLEAPPEYGFSSSPHINILNGKWYSKYPFGNALMLTLGVLVNAHWLIPALVTGSALLLLYLMVQEAYGKRVAILAAILGLVSPATLGMGCTWFSEPVSRFYLAIYLLALIRALKGSAGSRRVALSLRRRALLSVLSGFALGYAFNTRPVSAVALGFAGACFAIYWIARSREKAAILRTMLIFLIPFFLMMGLCAAWNYYFTGDPLKFTHNAAQPYDKIGFGKRAEGYEPDLEFVFTPKYALERIWRHTLPCTSFNALGWGYYRPNLFRSYHTDSVVAGLVAKSPAQVRRDSQSTDDENWVTLTLRVIPLAFPFILMLIPIFHPSRNRYDFLFLAFLLFSLLLYFPFYFEGSTWGITPVNARYYAECTLLGIIPLVARGMFIFYGWVRRIPSKLPVGLIGLLLMLLTANTVYTYVLIGRPYRNWGPVYQKLPRLVKQENIHHAVIFVPRHRGAPIGDYPFQNLQDADIVYFKLGPSKVWRLTNSNWYNVYEQYFKGRNAYIYESGQLMPLLVSQ